MVTLTNGGLFSFNETDLFYLLSNQPILIQYKTFTSSDLIENANWRYPPLVCVPGKSYHWGFSQGRMVVIIPLTMVWCWGMYEL